VLFRLTYLGVTHAIALLRLLPMSDRDKDAEILALRHQIAVLERHLHGESIRFTPADRALLAALLHRLPRDVLRAVSGCWSARRPRRKASCGLGSCRRPLAHVRQSGQPSATRNRQSSNRLKVLRRMCGERSW